MSLNEKQSRFAREYLVDLNATQAAIRAGYSERTAHAQGHRLLSHAEVADAIQRLKGRRAERTEVKADRVLEELAHIAFSDITEIVSGGAGAVLYVQELSSLPEHVRRCIAEVSEVQSAEGGGQLKVKLHSKVQALRMLMDHLGMDAPKKLAGADGGPVQVQVTPASEDEALAALQRMASRDKRVAKALKGE